MTFSKDDLSGAFHQVMRERIPDLSNIPDHVFSERFEKKMNKLIRREAMHPRAVSRTPARNLIAAAIVIIFLAGSSVFAYHQYSTKAMMKRYTGTVMELPENFAELPKYQQTGSYAFDPDDKSLMSGFSDDTVVAYVNEVEGTSYQNVRMDEGVLKGTPYTCYEIRILKNIKGSLRCGQPIPVYQYGGVTIDGQRIEYITDLLEKDKYYVLYLSVENDTNLYLNRAYVIPCEGSAEEFQQQIEDTNGILSDFYNALINENTEFAPNTRYKSPYDAAE